jgi:hypothetical protein
MKVKQVVYTKKGKKKEIFIIVKVRFEGLKNCIISKGISLECEICVRVMLRHMVVIYDMLILLQCFDEVKG